MKLCIGIVLGLLAALDAPLVDPEAPAPQTGSLWERVQAARAATLAAQPGDLALYQLFEGFTPEVLREALGQRIDEINEQYKDKPPAELKPLLLDAIETCLHAYPVVARRPEDRAVFFDDLELQSRNTVYREYLIQRMAPGMAPPSLFGDFLLQGARGSITSLNSKLGRLAHKPSEPEFIQIAAMDSLYGLHRDSWLRLLQSEPELKKLLPAEGLAAPDLFSVKALAKAPERVRKQVEYKRAEFQQVAQVLSLHFSSSSPSTPALQTRALDLLRRLRAEAPLEDAGKVDSSIATAAGIVEAAQTPQ